LLRILSLTESEKRWIEHVQEIVGFAHFTEEPSAQVTDEPLATSKLTIDP